METKKKVRHDGDSCNIVTEHFESIDQMLRVVNNRPNNKIMRGESSSQKSDYDFTLTHNYAEATSLFENGYTKVLDKVKKGIDGNISSMMYGTKPIPKNAVVGYIPNVPNALLNLPKSMIHTERIVRKTKSINIVYSICDNCSRSADDIVRSGIEVLSLISSLEMNGIRTTLNLAFFNGKRDGDYAQGTVKLKDYREHLNLQKLCFPMAHPSMFRRFGFKWIETVGGLEQSGWSFGYGCNISNYDKDSVLKKHILDEDDVYISVKMVADCGFDYKEVIKKLDLIK